MRNNYTVFEAAKYFVTISQALQKYASVGDGMHHGRIACPIHRGRNKNFSFNDEYFHCFKCGASGDVISFVSLYLGIGNYEAAQKIASDFGLMDCRIDEEAQQKIEKNRLERARIVSEEQRLNSAYDETIEKLDLCREAAMLLAPTSESETYKEGWLDALNMIPELEYEADKLLEEIQNIGRN